MVLDVVAIVTPAPGKEARLEELLTELTGNVEENEPEVAKYMAYKTQNAEGATEYVFIERYKDESVLEAHMKTEHFQAAGKKFGEEGLLTKAPIIYQMQALSGFDSR